MLRLPPDGPSRAALGPLLTLTALGLVELSAALGAPIPTPLPVIRVCVLAAALLGGTAAGLVSAALGLAYLALRWSVPGHPFQLLPALHSRMALAAAVTPALAFLGGGVRTGIQRRILDAREAEERFRELSDASLEGIAIHEHGRILMVNRALSRLMGVPAGFLVGRDVREFSASESAAAVEAHLRGRVTGSYEAVAVRPDGTRFPVEVTSREVVFQGRRARAAVLRDLTERKAMEEALRASEALFRSAFESTPLGMAVVGLDGRFLRVNEALCRITGRTEAELLATDFRSITHPDDLGRNLDESERLLSGEIASFQMEKRYLRKDGGVVWGLLTDALVRDAEGRPVLFVAQVQDITERRQVERLKQEFVGLVSHELRTPMTALLGSLGLLERGMGEALGDEARELVRLAGANGRRLLRLINDILDLERLETGRLALERTELQVAPLLEEALRLHRDYAAPLGVELVLEACGPELRVLADEFRVMQVLGNLLSNAAKFSPRGAPVRVRALRRGERVRIEVEDQGTGIPEEFRPLVFQKFAQARESQARHAGGSGLGLSISKALVERMDGDIGFDTAPGRGTTFWFEVPAPAAG